MDPLLETIAAALRDDRPLDAPQRRALLEALRHNPSPALEAAALILDDPELVDGWTDALEPEAPLRLTAFVQRDDEAAEEAIDQAIASGGVPAQRVVEALARSQSGWHHPQMTELLDGPAQGACLALLLSAGERDQVLAHIEASETPLQAIEALMPLLADYPALFEELLAEGDDPETVALRSAVTIDAVAQEALGGELDWELLTRDEEVVALALRHSALPSWTETLAWSLRDDDRDLTQLAAEITLVAAWAYAQASASDREIDVAALQAFLVHEEGTASELNQRAEQTAIATGLGWVVALAGEGAERLFVEIAAHETLLALGAKSPGIPGLVLTPSDRDELDLEAIEAMVLPEEMPSEMEAESRLAQLKTLLDLRQWAARHPETFGELAQRSADYWDESQDVLLASAARGDDSREDDDEPDLGTLDGLARLTVWSREREIERLAALWAQVPWPQMVLVEDALFEALRREATS